MLEQALREVLDDLPWVDHVRLVVGPLASRESVKDLALERAPVLPSWAIGTLHDLAVEILNKSKVSVDKSLSLSSQCDALEKIASTEFVKSAVPELCVHLKNRGVATKIARFLSQLDKYCLHDQDVDAILEYFQEKDPHVGQFLKVVAHLWAQGELQPWSEGDAYRKLLALEGVNDGDARLPRRVWLWGFQELVPLEEAFVRWLLERGVEVRFLAPTAAAEWLRPKCEALGAEFTEIEDAIHQTRVWEPHSAWDELEFLRDELARLKGEGVRWSEIALFVPADDLYKRLVRHKLKEWNVPLLDPNLSGGWKDKPRWLWWRDFFRILASGLKIDDVRAWLGPGTARKELFAAAYERGVHGSAGQWKRMLEKADLPELRLLVEAVPIFGRAMRPKDFLAACEQLVPRAEQLLGGEIESPLVLEFARHLCEERPYLDGFRARLHRFVALFEEFLETRARTESLRARDGVRFVAHEVWLPTAARHAFVLGANLIERARRSADAWDWDAVEARRLWEKLHFTSTWEERARRDQALLLDGLHRHGNVTVSAVEYGLGGEPLPKSAIYQKLKGTHQPERAGGHEAVGWLASESREGAAGAKLPETLTRPDLSAALIKNAGGEKPLRVSAFEDYLRCPFVFFARHVLGLDREDELGLDPDGRARGNILHKVLERFLADEIAGKLYPTPDGAKARIRELVDEEIASQKLSGMFRHKPLVEKARANLVLAAERWVDWEFDNREKHPSVKPVAVELPIEFELAPGFRMRGKADRVDGDGKHSVVIDYKSGGAPLIGKELVAGIGAQLLMYSYGVERLHKLEPGAAFYLTVGRKVEGKNGVFLKKHQKKLHTTHARNSGLVDLDFGTLFEQVTENWRQAAERLRAGDFGPRPARGKKDCDSCNFKNVCGYDHETAGGEGE